VAIRYKNRERRLERTISRIEAARRAIAEHTKTASEHRTWWRRHGGTLEAWRTAIAERQHRQPAEKLATATSDFQRWTSRLRWHPTLLRLRLECWWLNVKLGMRGIARGPRS
jgi:predicted anti-sigma-YlaC factor YlaD